MLKKLRCMLCMVLIAAMLTSGAAENTIDWNTVDWNTVDWNTSPYFVFEATYYPNGSYIMRYPGAMGIFKNASQIPPAPISSNPEVASVGRIYNDPGYDMLSAGIVIQINGVGETTIKFQRGISNVTDEGETFYTYYDVEWLIIVKPAEEPLEISLSLNTAQNSDGQYQFTLKDVSLAPSLTVQYGEIIGSEAVAVIVGVVTKSSYAGVVVGVLLSAGVTTTNHVLSNMQYIVTDPAPVSLTLTIKNPNDFDVTNATYILSPERGLIGKDSALNPVRDLQDIIFAISAHETVTMSYQLLPEASFDGIDYSYSIKAQVSYISSSNDEVVSSCDIPIKVISQLKGKEKYSGRNQQMVQPFE